MPRKRRSRTNDQEPPRKWRRVIIYSDSDESEKSDSNQPKEEENVIPNESTLSPDDVDNTTVLLPETDPLPPTEPSLETLEPDIDAELLAALGDPADDVPTYGENIPQDLAQRWLPILRKGIPKEKKEALLKEYSVPENCKLLRAPSLNAEISAATSEVLRKRDKYLETKQNQLGLGITAMGRGLSQLLTSDDKHKKVQAIKSLSDGCRILCDLHNLNTQTRIKLLTPSLDKAFLHVIEDLERDETLFSSKLSEKIKASKTIEKQGLQIKKTPNNQKSSSAPSSSRPGSTSSSRTQGNWASSSRYQPPNRGGARGGAYKYGTRSRKPPTATTQKSPASTSTQRAQPR